MSLVLVVDDTPGCRVPMALLLRAQGFETRTACNGEEALEALDTSNPALVVLDLAMPVMDGIAFLRIVRDTQRWASLPVIVVSGESSHGALKTAIELRADDVLVKGKFTSGELLATIRRHLAKRARPEDVQPSD